MGEEDGNRHARKRDKASQADHTGQEDHDDPNPGGNAKHQWLVG